MAELPLFPLRTVLFPDGLLDLRIFEARYLDLVSRCWRESAPFGVVALRSGSEARSGGDSVQLYEAGTLAELIDVDSAEPGILAVRCRGGALQARRGRAPGARRPLGRSDRADRRRPRRRAGAGPRRHRAGARRFDRRARRAGNAAVRRAASPRLRRLGRRPLVRDPAASARSAPAPAGARRSTRAARSHRIVAARSRLVQLSAKRAAGARGQRQTATAAISCKRLRNGAGTPSASAASAASQRPDGQRATQRAIAFAGSSGGNVHRTGCRCQSRCVST